MGTAVAEDRMTAAEFIRKYGNCSGVELVRGRVVWAGEKAPAAEFRMPRFKHGVVSHRVWKRIADFVEANRLGWMAINDTFVTVDPEEEDTVRGPDALYVSYDRMPPGPIPDDLPVTPDLVVEVRSPTNDWTEIFTKVGEYLRAGVTVVVVVDPFRPTVSLYRASGQEVLPADGDLTIPDVLPGFRAAVRELFE